jgi:ribosomal protein S18 acetylase RimI-like enzyme
MYLVPYDPSLAEALCHVYNEAVRHVPHCYPVSVERFAAEMPSSRPTASQAALAMSASDDELVRAQVLVAMERGVIAGFVHFGLRRDVRLARIDGPAHARPVRAESRIRSETKGIVRFLWYRRGERRSGQALLDAAEEAWSSDPETVAVAEAFHYDHRYPFYHLEHAYLSGYLDHVHALLGANGYRRAGSELALDWPNYRPVRPDALDLAVEFTDQWRQGRGQRPGLIVKAHRRDKEVGVCICSSLGEVADADEAQDWLYVRWLAVSEELQGHGLGRHLLRRALHAMHGVGYRHATICTYGDNYPAFLLYSNMGYRVVDWTYCFSKTLDGPS